MLNLVLKTGDRLMVGDDIIIKLQSESRVRIAIDAPRDIEITRIAADKVNNIVKKESNAENK